MAVGADQPEPAEPRPVGARALGHRVLDLHGLATVVMGGVDRPVAAGAEAGHQMLTWTSCLRPSRRMRGAPVSAGGSPIVTA